MFRMIVLSSFMVLANVGFADAGQQQQQQQQQQQKQGAQQRQQQQQKQQRAHQQQQQGQQKQQGVQGQTEATQVDADAAYACFDGRWPVQGFCRDRFLGVVTDCYNVIGYGLRSNQCAQLGGYAGYPVQILDGRGYTYCDCHGAVY